MKLVIDMNLSPVWSDYLSANGHMAEHWGEVGSPHAPDSEILAWARENCHIVITHDLDFGAILAATQMDSPSVIQVRSTDPTPERCGGVVLCSLLRYGQELDEGALLSIDEVHTRIRILPIRRSTQ